LAPKPSVKNKATTVPNVLVVRLEMFFTLPSDTSTPKKKRWLGGKRVQKAQFVLQGTSLPAKEVNGVYKIPLASLNDGDQYIEVQPHPDQKSDGPGSPSTGTTNAKGTKYQFRPFQLKLSVSKTDQGRKVDDTPQVVLFPALMKVKSTAKYESPASYAMVYTWSGKKQELVIDWKPDWIYAGNHNVRSRIASDVEVIVLHGTATPDPPIGLFCNTKAARRVSAHYVLDLDGHIIKMVHEANVSWHAGGSFWKGKTDINENSVGIEMVHAMTTAELTKPARAYPDDQYAGLMVLMESLLATYTTAGRLNVVGHSDIATINKNKKPTTILGNKMDPYYDFEWVRLEDAGMARRRAAPQDPPASNPTALGVDKGKVYKYGDNDPVVAQVKQALKDIGYSIAASKAGQSTVTQKYDAAMRQAVFSFQLRYWSEPNFTGIKPADRGNVDYETAYAIQKVREDT
jgi:N-acetyl-anhydromuramyl-L-alanine amidase AmpD